MGVAEVEPQCSGRDKWLGRWEGWQGSHSSLLYCYFILSPSEKNADTVSPAVLSSEKIKHWKEVGVCRAMWLQVSNRTVSACFQEPGVNAYVPLATVALPVRSARGTVRGTPSPRRQSQLYLGASLWGWWLMDREWCPALAVPTLPSAMHEGLGSCKGDRYTSPAPI